MYRGSIAVGDVYGDLTVLSIKGFHVEPSGHRRRKVLVRCNCGKEYELVANNLTRGSSTCCKNCSVLKRSKVKIGDIFDKLTVKSFS